MGTIYGCINQKGGVGKSISAFNLGFAMARKLNKKDDAENRVLLLDFDAQSSLTILMGNSQPDELDNTVAELLMMEIDGKDYDVKDYIKTNDNVDYIASNISLCSVEYKLVGEIGREYFLRDILAKVRDRYDVIIVDSGPSLGLLSINALTAIDKVLIPIVPDFLSLKGLELLMASIKNVKKKLNPALEIEGILYNQYNPRQKNTKEIDNILNTLVGNKIRIFNTKIPASVKVKESTLAQKNMFAFSKRNAIADAYEGLAKEIV